MKYQFRKALDSEIPQIWKILQQAIERRKNDGSNQWQNGYPNPETIQNDIAKGNGYVLTDQETVIAYSAVIINDEPAYLEIDGQWLTNGDFVVIHRVAISEDYLGQGLVQQMFGLFEDFALENNIHSIKVDTNFDNPAMLRIMDKLGYTYCGEVFFNGSPRKAFEKVLKV
ncbi:GNAT family N-acetyltransferase [Flavobacterium amniphilum]|uniref:GNAT family N-acetyltransferase n=1 Tax=Flavobacterium amniphilum TaxID=1834035 RepID=UPI002029BF60|nr:GNAT family N-acetyltransferase [Flavobacterium amniphilum]MCL9806666.1 GNAT family N-acetyltransferase [Flavobacterium amniphilum]